MISPLPTVRTCPPSSSRHGASTNLKSTTGTATVRGRGQLLLERNRAAGPTMSDLLARRLLLPGHRLAPVVLARIGPFAPLVIGGGFAFLWCGSAAPSQRTLLRAGAVLAAVIVVGSLVLYVMKDARADKAIEELPLVLFDGTTADSPFPSWKRDAFTNTAVRSESGFAPEGHEAYLKYFTAPGVAFITMRTDAGECSPTLLRGYTCRGPRVAAQRRASLLPLAAAVPDLSGEP